MEMQQESEVTDDGFGIRVEVVGTQVVCEEDNILQEDRNHAEDPDVPLWVSCDFQTDITHNIKASEVLKFLFLKYSKSAENISACECSRGSSTDY